MDQEKTPRRQTAPRNNQGVRGTGSAAEKKKHQESLKRQKQYKKKRKQQVIGLVLECLLLVIVIGAYVGISYVYDTLNKITITDNTTAAPTEAAPTLPDIGPGISGTEAPTKATRPTDVSGTGDETSEPEETDPPTNEEVTFPSVDIPEHDGYYTFVLYGVDARDTDHLLSGTNGDVCIIASINKDSGEIRLASVYRDFSIEVSPGYDRKLTDCYSRYGAQELTELLNRNFDLNITNFVSVNWLCLVNIVDELGGLDVELSEAEAQALDNYVWEISAATGKSEKPEDMFIGNYHKDDSSPIGYYTDGYHAGVWHLNGVQVVSYSRLRYDLGDDFKRTERQRKVIGLVLEKAKTMGVGKITSIISIITDNLRTNLTGNELVSLALQYKKYTLGAAAAFPVDSSALVSTSSLKWYIYCYDYINQVIRLHEYLYGDTSYTPSENVERIGAYQYKRVAERDQ